MSRRRERSGETVISVTSAQPSRSADLDSRIVRYAWMMSIRIVCFVLAVITPSPWRWMFIVAAVFLPYIAVVLANTHRNGLRSGRRRGSSHRPIRTATTTPKSDLRRDWKLWQHPCQNLPRALKFTDEIQGLDAASDGSPRGCPTSLHFVQAIDN